MKISPVPMSKVLRPTFEAHPDGKFVPLPLDASAVPDAVVEKVVAAMQNAVLEWFTTDQSDLPAEDLTARAAIAALAQALGES